MLAAAALLGTLCAGCAGASATSSSSSSSPISMPTTGGAVVFARDCSACHSLVGNESEHKQGGDLIGYGMDRAQLLLLTRTMPTRAPLSDGELQAVVGYILAANRRAGR